MAIMSSGAQRLTVGDAPLVSSIEDHLLYCKFLCLSALPLSSGSLGIELGDFGACDDWFCHLRSWGGRCSFCPTGCREFLERNPGCLFDSRSRHERGRGGRGSCSAAVGVEE